MLELIASAEEPAAKESHWRRVTMLGGDNGAAHTGSVDRRLDPPLGLRLLNELARVCEAGIASLRHCHRVRIDAGSAVEYARTGQLIGCLEQAGLDAEDRIGFPGFQQLQCAGETRRTDHLRIFQGSSKKDLGLGL